MQLEIKNNLKIIKTDNLNNLKKIKRRIESMDKRANTTMEIEMFSAIYRRTKIISSQYKTPNDSNEPQQTDAEMQQHPQCS